MIWNIDSYLFSCDFQDPQERIILFFFWHLNQCLTYVKKSYWTISTTVTYGKLSMWKKTITKQSSDLAIERWFTNNTSDSGLI